MRNKLFLVVFILGFMFWYGSTALAGNIDPSDDGHQYAWGENVGWLNFEPDQGIGVTVASDYITGYVWAENIGWINLSPSTAGVTHDGSGNLSGWAWGENVGWISFSCENTSSCSTVDYGVIIDSNSLFDGYAWGENIGWINFEIISQPAYIVETSYGTEDTDGDTIPDWVDNCPDTANSNQEDVDNDGIGDFCDVDTVYGTVSGDVQEGISVNFYTVSCGVTQPYATVITDTQGYYAIGGLANRRYLVDPDYAGYCFAPEGFWVDIPQAVIQSYDFATTKTYNKFYLKEGKS